MASRRPALGLVVVTHDQERELPRTLRSLLPPYQRPVAGGVELVVVDNGSSRPVADWLPSSLASQIRLHRIADAPPSPAHAANLGLDLTQAELIGLIVDGARLASPGLLASATLAARLGQETVITAPAWHLGPDLQTRSEQTGYSQAAEDDLLEASGWEDDGYRLFSVATPAASSGRGLFGPMGESSSLFLRRGQWDALGGLDERFALPGGGLVNHDLYRRACALPGVQLAVLLGEGTFHQIHGGAATSGRVTREAMRAEYRQIVGAEQAPPPNEPLFVGSIPSSYLPYLERSIAKVPRGTIDNPPAVDVDPRGEDL